MTLTANVSSAGGTPTGQVQFFDGTTSLGTAALGSGVAVLTTATLGVGSHSLSATYLGDGSFLPSTSPATLMTVARAQTRMTLAGAPNPSSRKQLVTVTATLSAVSPGAGTPSGQVQLFEGKKKLGTATLVSGSASFQVSFNSMGQQAVRAVYAGDGQFSAVEAAYTQLVNR